MKSFSEWREFGDNLNRFASIREKADAPSDRIIVQNKGGIQKVVAGDTGKTLIVTVGETDQPDGRAVVPSRIFLGTLRTLKGKGTAEVKVTESGASIVTNFQSEIEIENLSSPFKMLSPKPFAPGGWTATFPAGFLPAAARYLSSTGEFSPYNQVLAETKEDGVYFRATENHIVSVVGPIPASHPATFSFPDHVFPALRGLESGGGIYVPLRTDTHAHQAQIKSGPYRVVCVLWQNYPKFPWVDSQEYAASVTGDKKVLIDTFKSLSGRHQYSRVTMSVDGEDFLVKAGDSGVARMKMQVSGKASLPVNAAFIAKILQTVDGKVATIKFSPSPSHVRIVGEGNLWPILVSPMR